MAKKIAKNISVLEFGCQAPLKFFEHCSKCARFSEGCPDLTRGKEILRGKKKINYGDDHTEDTVHITAFNCLTPLYYFESSRKKCAHEGRCREEGLLLALLDGKKALDYSHKEVTELPRKWRRKVSKVAPATAQKAAS